MRVCYGKGRSHKDNHKTSKVYEEDKQAYLQTHPQNVRKARRSDEGKNEQAAGGGHVGLSHGGNRRSWQIDEVSWLLRTATKDSNI